MLHGSVELGSIDIPEDGEFQVELPERLAAMLLRGTAVLRPIVFPCSGDGGCSGRVYEIRRIEIVNVP